MGAHMCTNACCGPRKRALLHSAFSRPDDAAVSGAAILDLTCYRGTPLSLYTTVALRRLQLCSCVVDPDSSGARSLGPCVGDTCGGEGWGGEGREEGGYTLSSFWRSPWRSPRLLTLLHIPPLYPEPSIPALHIARRPVRPHPLRPLRKNKPRRFRHPYYYFTLLESRPDRRGRRTCCERRAIGPGDTSSDFRIRTIPLRPWADWRATRCATLERAPAPPHSRPTPVSPHAPRAAKRNLKCPQSSAGAVQSAARRPARTQPAWQPYPWPWRVCQYPR